MDSTSPDSLIPTTMDPATVGELITSYVCYEDGPLRTFERCGFQGSDWNYRPTRSTNLAFAVLFCLSMVAFLGQGIVYRQRWGFTIAMVTGCALEVIGYIARAQAHHYLWSENLFLIQIVCLTIAPAFLAAGIYLCLSGIVTTFGSENSRLKPRSYPKIFIVCDIISLVLQATGGALASVATHESRKPDKGNHIMIAGLAFQVFTLVLFMLLSLDFALRTYRRVSSLNALSTLHQRHVKLRASWIFKAFLVALALSTLCIFTRCVYRVAELSQGWSGHLMLTQKYFVGLEGAVVVAAVLLLNLFHPALCFDEVRYLVVVPDHGGTWYGRSRSGGSSGFELREFRSEEV